MEGPREKRQGADPRRRARVPDLTPGLPQVLPHSVHGRHGREQLGSHGLRAIAQQRQVAVGGGAHRTAFEYLMEKGQGNRDQVKSIKFNGPVPAVQSVASYDGKTGTEFGIMPIAVANPLVQAGKVKIIGFTGDRRVSAYPNVPFLSTVAPGINVYSFALTPEEHQPSGTCNFSRVDIAQLNMTITAATFTSTLTQSNTDTAKCRIYATNYNVLRVLSGMAGLAFTN